MKATRIELACIWPQLGIILHHYRTYYDVVPCKLSNAEAGVTSNIKNITSGDNVATDIDVFQDATQLDAVGMQA
jgi:hypothetical protein